MKTNRRLPIAVILLTIACTALFCSTVFASDEKMKQVHDLYAHLLKKYSDECILKDSTENSCTDVVFATQNKMLSSSLKLLLAKDAKRAKKDGGVGNLDFDFLINGQEYCEAPLRIVSLKKSGNGYVMQVNNGCRYAKGYTSNYEFHIINEAGAWVIDNAAYYFPQKVTLKGILK